MLYGNGLISQHGKESGSKLYYHFNNVGSTTAVTDASGNVKYSYEYSPYGELIKGTYGQVMFLYNGQYGVTSDDNGLYYMRARYYNIAIKRFCNQDVLTGEIGESQSLNRFAYVEGNPVSYFDPFGLEKASESSSNFKYLKRIIIDILAPEVKFGKTVSYGLNATASYGLTFGSSFQLVFDSDYNIALLIAMPVGVGTADLSVSVSRGVTDTPTYEGLMGSGLSYNQGIGSIGASTTYGGGAWGRSISYGIGVAPSSTTITYSYTLDICVFLDEGDV